MSPNPAYRSLAAAAVLIGAWALCMSIGATRASGEADSRPSAVMNGPPALSGGRLPSDTPAPATAPATQPGHFQPLRDAKAGEWVSYRARGDRRLEYEIVETDSQTVVVRVTVAEGGNIIGRSFVRRESRRFDPTAREADGSERPSSSESVTLEAGGGKWSTRLNTDRWTEEGVDYVRRTWVSDQIPVFGVVKMELRGDDQCEAELTLVGFEARTD